MGRKKKEVKPEPQVVLKMSMDQAMLVARACEFYMRMRNGQYDELAMEMVINKHLYAQPFDRQAFEEHLYQARKMLFPKLYRNSHYGIRHDTIGDRAWEMYEVIRHALAWYRHPEGGMGVDFDTPLPLACDSVLAKCEIVLPEEGKR